MAASTFGSSLGSIAEAVRRCTIQVLAHEEMACGSGVVVSRGLAMTNATWSGARPKAGPIMEWRPGAGIHRTEGPAAGPGAAPYR